MLAYVLIAYTVYSLLLHFHLGFPLVIPFPTLSQFALSTGNFAETLHAFCAKCVHACVGLRVCVCVERQHTFQGEATKCSTALTWWQMKIKRLLLKMGGLWDFEGTCKAKSMQWRVTGLGCRKVWEGIQHCTGLWEYDGIFGKATKSSFFLPTTWVVKCHDRADRSNEKVSDRWPNVIMWNVALSGLMGDQAVNEYGCSWLGQASLSPCVYWVSLHESKEIYCEKVRSVDQITCLLKEHM